MPRTTPASDGNRIRRLMSIRELDAAAWNRLHGGNPALDWHFLAALEQTAARPEYGWLAAHLVIEVNGAPAAAAPAWLKAHSHGDFVYDWHWAHAARRSGFDWYPKLVCEVPYTPLAGPRLLAAPGAETLLPALAAALGETAERDGLATVQVNFAAPADHAPLATAGFLHRRDDVLFRWIRPAGDDPVGGFESYLMALQPHRRKTIRQERRRLAAAGIACRWLPAAAAGPAEHALVAACQNRTFQRYGNLPLLPAAFFSAAAESPAQALWYCLAERHGQPCAAAVFLKSDDTLYGRYWGMLDDIPLLHFELCYYQGIEFCLQHGLAAFEPGVLGEHKRRRGFQLVPTWSYHYFPDRRLRRAAAAWIADER